VTVLFCLGLRVSELVGLNLEDTDLERGSTWIKSKGRRERELVPLPAPGASCCQGQQPGRRQMVNQLIRRFECALQNARSESKTLM
jgi:site-specific recombinase XerC